MRDATHAARSSCAAAAHCVSTPTGLHHGTISSQKPGPSGSNSRRSICVDLSADELRAVLWRARDGGMHWNALRWPAPCRSTRSGLDPVEHRVEPLKLYVTIRRLFGALWRAIGMVKIESRRDPATGYEVGMVDPSRRGATYRGRRSPEDRVQGALAPVSHRRTPVTCIHDSLHSWHRSDGHACSRRRIRNPGRPSLEGNK